MHAVDFYGVHGVGVQQQHHFAQAEFKQYDGTDGFEPAAGAAGVGEDIGEEKHPEGHGQRPGGEVGVGVAVGQADGDEVEADEAQGLRPVGVEVFVPQIEGAHDDAGNQGGNHHAYFGVAAVDVEAALAEGVVVVGEVDGGDDAADG